MGKRGSGAPDFRALFGDLQVDRRRRGVGFVARSPSRSAQRLTQRVRARRERQRRGARGDVTIGSVFDTLGGGGGGGGNGGGARGGETTA